MPRPRQEGASATSLLQSHIPSPEPCERSQAVIINSAWVIILLPLRFSPFCCCQQRVCQPAALIPGLLPPCLLLARGGKGDLVVSCHIRDSGSSSMSQQPGGDEGLLPEPGAGDGCGCTEVTCQALCCLYSCHGLFSLLLNRYKQQKKE